MTSQCPVCPQTFEDAEKLRTHLVRTHHLSEHDAISRVIKGQGYYEDKEETRSGEYKAPEHQAAAYRVQMQKEKPLTVPMIPVEVKKEPTIAAGWKKTTEGYSFEETLFEKNTAENVILKKIKAKLTPNHGIATLYTFDKDIAELSELQEKSGILDAKLQPLLPADPAFVTIAAEQHDLLFKIRKMKKELQPEVYTETALEGFFHGIFGSDEHVKWQEEFMQKTIAKTEELKKICEDIEKEDE